MRRIQTSFFERYHGYRRVPERRNTGLDTQRTILLNLIALEKADFARQQRVAPIAALRKQREDRIHHGRIDGAEAFAALQPFEHPLAGASERATAKRVPGKALIKLQATV